MVIKGNILDEVQIKAVIRGVEVTEDGITYKVNINPGDPIIEVPESKVIFPAGKFKLETPEDTVKKKPGRPKKATVESTMEKLAKMRGE